MTIRAGVIGYSENNAYAARHGTGELRSVLSMRRVRRIHDLTGYDHLPEGEIIELPEGGCFHVVEFTGYRTDGGYENIMYDLEVVIGKGGSLVGPLAYKMAEPKNMIGITMMESFVVVFLMFLMTYILDPVFSTLFGMLIIFGYMSVSDSSGITASLIKIDLSVPVKIIGPKEKTWA